MFKDIECEWNAPEIQNDPHLWISRRPMKWKDETGRKHRSYVRPIKALPTDHLRNIIGSEPLLIELEKGSVRWQRLMNVIKEFKKRLKERK